MPKNPLKTEPISATQLRTVSEELKRLSGMIESAAKTAEKQENSTIAVYNWLSCQLGLEKIQAFANDAHKAKTLADLGTPRPPGQMKPRVPKKFTGQMLDDAIEKTSKNTPKKRLIKKEKPSS